MNQVQTSVVIIGGGLTGLSLAFLLEQKGIDWHLIERMPYAGGVMQTKTRDGFTYETGPNTGVLGNPEVVELFEMLAPACSIELANEQAAHRWILKNGRWKALPSGLLGGISTPLFSFKDKLRLLLEPMRKKGDNPMETVAALVQRRMGKSFLDYAVDPFISGIYAGDPDALVVQYALPKLYRLEQDYGSFIRGGIKKARQQKSIREQKASRKVFAAKGGFSKLIAAIVDQLPPERLQWNALEAKVQTNDPASYRVTYHRNGELQAVDSHFVVTATASTALPYLLPQVQQHQMVAILKTPYARVNQIIMAFNKWNGKSLNAFGGLIPSREKRNILGVLFPSSIFAGRAPEGGALLSVFAGGIKKPELFDLDDDTLMKIVRDELEDLFQISSSTLAFSEIYRYKQAIPQYDASSPEKLKAVAAVEKQFPGLIIGGNVLGGIGIADRIKQAFDIAERLQHQIQKP